MVDLGHLRLVDVESNEVMLVYRPFGITNNNHVPLPIIRQGACEAAEYTGTLLIGKFQLQALYVDDSQFVWRNWTGIIFEFENPVI